MFDAEQTTSLADVQHQLAAVKQLLEKLTGDKVQQLVMVNTSKRYLVRLEHALKQKGGQQAKFVRWDWLLMFLFYEVMIVDNDDDNARILMTIDQQ